MYKRIDPPDEIMMVNGAKVTPAYSLADEYGGVAHIIVDDRCYVLVLKNCGGSGLFDAPWDAPWDGSFKTAHHWFDEAVKALRDLPPPSERSFQEGERG